MAPLTQQQDITRLDVNKDIVPLQVAVAHPAGVQRVAHDTDHLVEDVCRARWGYRRGMLRQRDVARRAFFWRGSACQCHPPTDKVKVPIGSHEPVHTDEAGMRGQLSKQRRLS